MNTIEGAEQEIKRSGSLAHATPVGMDTAGGRNPKGVAAIKFIPASFISLIMLFDYPDGEYSVEYCDADGTRHPISKSTIL